MSASVLLVCEGNICRSPLACALLRLDFPEIEVESAGTRALVGAGADPLAIALARRQGMDLSNHVARALTPELVRHANLILTMSKAQRALILATYPFATGKVFCLGEREQIDIVDPYRRHAAVFELAFAQIEHSVSNWHDVITSLAH